MERNTIQKKVILDYLKSVKSHPTVDEIYKAVSKKLPNISKGTVYRLLKNFQQKNLIRELCFDVNHFDAELSCHNHFICKHCKKVFDILDFKLPVLNILNKTIKYSTDRQVESGKVSGYQLTICGLCQKCNKKIKEN